MFSPAKSMRPAQTSTRLMIALSSVVLPAPLAPEQHHRFMLVHDEIDAPQHLQTPIAGGDARDSEQRSRRLMRHSRLRARLRVPACPATPPPAGLRKSPYRRS